MKKNVGTWDALFRITFGLAGLAWSISRMTRWPYRTSLFTRFMLWMSAMKVAEGVTRFCPMLFAFGVNSDSLTFRWNNPGKLHAQSSSEEQTAVERGEEQHSSVEPGRKQQTSASKTDNRPIAGLRNGGPIRARQIRKPGELQ